MGVEKIGDKFCYKATEVKAIANYRLSCEQDRSYLQIMEDRLETFLAEKPEEISFFQEPPVIVVLVFAALIGGYYTGKGR